MTPLTTQLLLAIGLALVAGIALGCIYKRDIKELCNQINELEKELSND